MPAAPNALIGRDAEVAALRATLGTPGHRLVTLTGPGVVGKTRLALAAAAAVETDGVFADGVAFVSLAAVAQPTQVAASISAALGLRERGQRSPLERVLAYLRSRRLLLVLDNVEHLLPVAAALVGDLLAGCGGLAVLVTSRERLRVSGEREVPVRPLALPERRLPDAVADRADDPARTDGDAAGIGYVLFLSGLGASTALGDYRARRELSEASLAHARRAGDTWGIAAALWSGGWAAFILGDPDAGPMIDDGLARFRAIGNAWGIAWAANAAGEVARARGDLATASARYAECVGHAQRLGDRGVMGLALHNLGHVAWQRGDPLQGETHLVASLVIQRDLGDREMLATCLAGLAGRAAQRGRPERAAHLAGAAAALFAGTGTALEPIDQAALDANLAVARRAMSTEAFAAAFATGRALSEEAAIAEALTLDPPADGRFRLTPRERQVLGLLVEGRSDKEIAGALSISPRTASNHVANLLRKLDVETRHGAARAGRDGLV